MNRKKKHIWVMSWRCPVCKLIFACNIVSGCVRCEQKQILGNGLQLKEIEDNNYYKLYM